MRKHISFFCFFCLLSLSTAAQNKRDDSGKKTSSFINMTEAGLLLGKMANGNSRTNFTFVTYNGYQFNSNISAGVIIGADAYNTTLIIPVGIGTRVSIGKADNKANPFLAFDAGYCLPVGKYHHSSDYPGTHTVAKKGLMINPAAGVQLNVGKDFGLTITLGFKQQRVSTYFLPDVDDQRIQKHTYNSVSLRMGVSF